MTLLQRRTPQRLMARVSVAAEVVMSVPSAASLALGALLVTVVDWRLLFAVIGVVTLAGAGHVAFWLRDVLREHDAVEVTTDPAPGPEPTPLDPGSTVSPT